MALVSLLSERNLLALVQRLALSDKSLHDYVARIATSMRKLGIGVGDRVAGYLPNCPEAIEIMAATASIGAIWSSTSPDFGVSGVLDRFQQISPKIIFSVEAVAYNTKVQIIFKHF